MSSPQSETRKVTSEEIYFLFYIKPLSLKVKPYILLFQSQHRIDYLKGNIIGKILDCLFTEPQHLLIRLRPVIAL